MSHLDDAVLRDYVDDPDVLLSYEKAHLLSCERCRSRLEALRANAAFAGRALSVDGAVDMRAARDGILQRSVSAAGAPDAGWTKSRRSSRTPQWMAAAAAAVVLAALFSYAPFRAYAANFLTIFEPRQFTPISVTQADMNQMRGIPELKEFGTVRETYDRRTVAFKSSGAAASAAHQTILRPAYLPEKVPSSATYRVSPRNTVSFTFDGRKAAATAARKHLKLPPVPPQIDGSTLTAAIGPVIVQSYGELPDKGAVTKSHRAHRMPANTIVIAQAPVPAVNSTTGNPKEIESYLLSLPDVPEDVKSQIRAISDPSSTLPVPVPVSKESAHAVTVQGAQGLLIGDNTGIGSIIIWQTHNTIYSVAGAYSADEILRVADSMKP